MNIYLNNAATSYPKPEAVVQRTQAQLLLPPEEQGRSSASAAGLAERCRISVAGYLGCPPENLHFTSGATESANLLIAGLQLNGVHVIATAAEHNCILRPLYNHRDKPQISIAPCDAAGCVSVKAIESLIQPNTGYLFVNHASNVTGCVQPLAEIAAMARNHGIRVIVDTSQSAGCIPIDIETLGIDGLIFTGHKNLFGFTGIGGMYLHPDLPVSIVKTGGTGSDSLWLTLPEGYQNREAGTQNLPGLASLEAGIAALEEIGQEEVTRLLRHKRKLLLQSLSGLPGIQVFHPGEQEEALPVVSFTSGLLSAGDLGYILSHGYGITLRTGYHCCPCIHKYLGTEQGTVRVSASILTPDAEILAFGQAMVSILPSLRR